MIYQYDQALPLPTKDLYDTQVMQMAIAAAKDMYDRGEKRIQDFYDKYGDFYTPITKDQENYNKYINQIGTTIDNLYATGIDPLRSVEGRTAIAQAIRNFPKKEVANIRQSAKNAEMFNKAKLELMQKGLYNPELDPYNGGTPESWDTVGSGKIFDVMSPTPYQNLATFSEPYFKGLKPTVVNKSKNGISYSEESITEDDIRKIANAKYNDLINTQQGRLMYMRFKDLAGGNEEQAKQMFVDSIVDANLYKTYSKNDYDDNYFKHKQLWLTEQKFKHDVEKDAADLQLKRDQLAATERIAQMRYGDGGSGSGSSSSSGSGGRFSGEGYKDDEYQLARTVSGTIASTQTGADLGVLDYSDFDEDAMSQTWPIAYREIVDDVYGDFMNKYDLHPNAEVKSNRNSVIGFTPNLYKDKNGNFNVSLHQNKLDTSLTPGYFTGSIAPASMGSIANYKQAKKDLQIANENLMNRLSKNYDQGKFTEWTHKPVSAGIDKNMIVIEHDEDALNRLHSIDELASNSFGVNFETIESNLTESLRKAVKKQDGLRMKSVSKIVPILDKDGVTHLYQLVQLFVETPGRNQSKTKYSPFNNGKIFAYDMGITTQRNPNFGLANNISSNLYLDENIDADTRQVGNMKVNKEVGVSNTAVKASPFIFPWQQ